jgi:transcription elongation factor Elf1
MSEIHVELSEQAISICKENYASNCGGCGLRPVCATHIPSGYEGLNKWNKSLNELAAELKGREQNEQVC